MKTTSVARIFLFAGCLSCTSDNNIDKALTVDEYIQLGVPDPGKRWDMDNFSQAHVALGKLKWDRPYQLPMKDSKKSGVLFDHMMSMDNMYFMHDSALTLNGKAEQISAFTKVYDYWTDNYSNPVINNYYHREFIYIQIFNIGVMGEMVGLALEIDKSDDPTAVVLKYGVEPIKTNYISCLTDNMKIQSGPSAYLEKDLDVMADSIYASIMRNKVWMDSAEINTLKESLRMVLDSTSSEHIQEQYSTLEKSM